MKKDVANYRKYAESTEAYLMKKRKEKAELDERNENLGQRLEQLKQGNAELEAACRFVVLSRTSILILRKDFDDPFWVCVIESNLPPWGCFIRVFRCFRSMQYFVLQC